MGTSLPEDSGAAVRIPSPLATALRDGKVIPFVGAGVSRAVRRLDSGEALFPSWPELLRRAVARVEEHAGDAAARPVRRALAKSPPDYYRAAEAARQALKNGWYEFLREQFDPEPGRAVAAEDSLELARKVWQLGSPLVITTNYDRVLEWVCPDVPRRWNVQEVFAQVETLKKGVQAPTVWHLHGHMDDPLSVILTVNDYKRLYRRGGTAHHRYEVALKTLHSLLVSHTFLFIGFSLDDADFALQLRELDKMFMGVTGPHYVLTQSAEEEHIRELDLPVKILTVSHYGPPLLEYVNALVENVFGGRRRNPALPPPGAARHDSPPDGGAPRPLFFVPFRQKRHKVIGRTEILRKIRAGLTGSEGPYGPAVSLQGIGGLGKTQIAVEYAFHFRQRYPNGVFWIDAARNIDEQLISIAGEVNWPWPGAPPAAKLGEARTRLRTTSECLIVFDNVAHVRDIREYLPANEARSHVLITSRSEQAGFPPIPLGLLDHEESLRMLFQEAGQMPTSQRQQKAAERIARRCGGLPLALELAGAYLRYRQVSWEKYWNLLQYNLKHALPREFQGYTEHDPDLFSTLRVDPRLFDREPLLEGVLDALTWSANAPMSVELLAALTGAACAEELESALDLGRSLHLLRELPNPRVCAIHPLVAEVRRTETALSGRPEWARDVCRRVAAWFVERRNDLDRAPRDGDLVGHLAAWQKHAQAHDPPSDAALSWVLAYPELHRGEFQSAALRIRAALEKAERHCPDDLLLTASIIDSEGVLWLRLGDPEKAIERVRTSLSMRLRTLGRHHLDTAQSYSNLGVCYRAAGDYRRALRFAERGLEIRRKFGQPHGIAESLTNIATTLRFQGRTEDALRWAKDSLRMFEQALGPEHPDTAVACAGVGEVLRQMRDFEEGWKYISRALAIRRANYGMMHPTTAASLHNVGLVLQELGDGREARGYLRRALYVRKEMLGVDHCNTLQSAYELARVLHDCGHTGRALRLIDIFERQLAPGNRDLPKLRQLREQIAGTFQLA